MSKRNQTGAEGLLSKLVNQVKGILLSVCVCVCMCVCVCVCIYCELMGNGYYEELLFAVLNSSSHKAN